MTSGALSACGASPDVRPFPERTPNEVFVTGVEALAAVDSARVRQTIELEGLSASADIVMTAEGDCRGRIEQDGGAAEVLGADGRYWLRADEAYWTALLAQTPAIDADLVAPLLLDRWISDPAGVVAGSCQLLETIGDIELDVDDPAGDDATMRAVETQAGDALEITAPVLSMGSVRAVVMVADPHYLVELQAEIGPTMRFSEFGVDVRVSEPPADQRRDLEDLLGG